MNAQDFGKYSLIKKLATGGMAEVFLAQQRGIEGFSKLTVVKRILPHLAEDPEFVQMFLNEAKIAARFNHPNIAQIYELGEINRAYFIAMEFIHGEDLGRLMRKAWSSGQWIAQHLAIRIVASACEGLHYAHAKADDMGRPLKVVHRDISPQNLLISFDGSVKVVDFGIAKAADQASMTKSGAIKGKFAYMAPEQAGGKPLDHRSDIFAIGLVLYELLTGVRPLKRDSELGTLQAAMECNIQPPSEVAEVSSELDPVVMRALAKNADDRYPDARQFQMALEEYLVTKRMVATSVQISELMHTLFAERLAEEAKLGHPDPLAANDPMFSGSAAMPPPAQIERSNPTEPKTTAASMSWEAPPGDEKSSSRSGPRTMAKSGYRSSESNNRPPVQPPPDVPAWDAPSASDVQSQSGRRRTGETRAAPPEDSRRLSNPNATAIARSPTGNHRAVNTPAPGASRRTASGNLPAVDFEDDGRGPVPTPARARRNQPEFVEDDATRLPPPAVRTPTPAKRKNSGGAPVAAPRRTKSQESVPARKTAGGMEIVDRSAWRDLVPEDSGEVSMEDSESDVTDTKRSRKAKKGSGGKFLQAILVLAVAIGGGFAVLLFKDKFTNPSSGNVSLSVKVEANEDVAVELRHDGENSSESERIGQGGKVLVPNAHPGDKIILRDNKGAYAEFDVPMNAKNGDTLSFRKEFRWGSFRANITPANRLSGLAIYLKDQQIAVLPSPIPIKLVEGSHNLQIRGAGLREPVSMTVTIIADKVVPANAKLDGFLEQ